MEIGLSNILSNIFLYCIIIVLYNLFQLIFHSRSGNNVTPATNL